MGRLPCCEKAHTNKGAWTKEEDHRLITYIRLHGEGCWRSLPKAAGLLRCGKSCRLRWINYLRPDLKRGNFTQEEDELILNLHSLLGNKWSSIAARLPGRTDNEIKNYWNTHIKRRLISQGLDPQTHRPLNFTTTGTATSVDFRNTYPSCIQVAQPTKLATDSVEDAKSNSGTTVETQPDHIQQERNNQALDLELTIGLPFLSELTVEPPPSTAPVAATAAVIACWCCQLRFQRGQLCGNCQNTNGFCELFPEIEQLALDFTI